ncbi:hypothetical protein RZS08_60670, partial [Arthrospira platensis SPKY1]|nr:hypothetical protein [Arthrospira platensis SPKY1]
AVDLPGPRLAHLDLSGAHASAPGCHHNPDCRIGRRGARHRGRRLLGADVLRQCRGRRSDDRSSHGVGLRSGTRRTGRFSHDRRALVHLRHEPLPLPPDGGRP